jgi:hypothetical protein
MIKRKNILKHAVESLDLPKIESSKKFIPDWFKKTDKFDKKTDKNVLPYGLTFKACSAFGEAFISGYMLPLSVDIAVKQTENGPSITWIDSTKSVLELRPKEVNEHLPTPNGFSELHFSWIGKHFLEIPKGYSMLFTHPLNRYDLPFLTLSAVIDGEFSFYPGRMPVFFSNTFEGVIKAGTPIAQIILFKTENWKNEFDQSIKENGIIQNKKSLNASEGWYKNTIWKKKLYE